MCDSSVHENGHTCERIKKDYAHERQQFQSCCCCIAHIIPSEISPENLQNQIKSANPDLAAKFINHLMSNDFIDDLMGVGRVPAQSPTIDPTSNLQAEVIAASNALVGANAKTFYTDWATPGMYDTVTQELQKVIGGAASAQDFMDAMAAESVN